MSEAFEQSGGCHCGALRYRITAPPLRTYLCHCTDCQRLSGSAFGIGVVVCEDSFSLNGSPRIVQRVLGSGKIGHRWTCSACGVWICGGPRMHPNTGVVQRIVRGGTLDETKWLKPTMHMWTRSAQPWFVFPQGATIYETAP
jgi:hypothetical protein